MNHKCSLNKTDKYLTIFFRDENSISKKLITEFDIDDSNVIKYLFVYFCLVYQKAKVHLFSKFNILLALP